MAAGDEITAAELALGSQSPACDEMPNIAELSQLPLTEAKTKLVESFERMMIATALEKHGGNVSAAARQLGIHRQNLQQKMTQFGITR